MKNVLLLGGSLGALKIGPEHKSLEICFLQFTFLLSSKEMAFSELSEGVVHVPG